MGFWPKSQVKSATRPDGKTYSCASCGLYKNGKNPKLPPQGNFRKKIMNIGIAPTTFSDALGKPWEGPHSKILKTIFRKAGIDLYEDCINLTACRCLPLGDNGKTRMPTFKEISCCRRDILKQIKEYKPKLIFLFGHAGVESLIGPKFKGRLENIHKWRGFQIPDRDYNAWLCPVFDLCLVLKYNSDGKPEVNTILENDMLAALKKLDEPFPDLIDQSKIRYPEGYEVYEALTKIVKNKKRRLISFDYESNSLKPYTDFSEVTCVAIKDENGCDSMVLETEEDKKLFRRIMVAPYLLKTAHNMKFEWKWTKNKFGKEVRPFLIDTMIAAHQLDNRQGITGLKFQGYVNFGIIGYDDEISPYLQGTEAKNSNSENRIKEFITKYGIKKVLTYCAMDAWIGYDLALKQIPEIGLEL